MQQKVKRQLLNVIIDKLTNSIENAQTGETFDTEVALLTELDLKLINKSDWQFNWKKKLKTLQKKCISFRRSATHKLYKD